MDTDLKLSFLANQAARTDMSSSVELKSRESAGDKSFEKTLRSKRNEVENRNGNEDVKSSDDVRRKDRQQVKEEKNLKGKDKEKRGTETKTDGAEVKREDAAERSQVRDERPENVKETKEASEGSVEKTAKDDKLNNKTVELSEDAAAELVSQIAETLGVTPEQITEALKNLNMTPEALAEQENVKMLIMEVNEMKEPAELLKISELTKKQKEITDAVMQALQNAEAKPDAANAGNKTQTAIQPQLEKTGAFAEATPEAQTANMVNADTETYSAEQKAENDTKAVKNPVAGEAVDNTEEAVDVNEPKQQVNEAAQKSNDGNNASGNQAQNGNNSRLAGGTAEASGEENSQIAAVNENEHTPIVIQKGDETVVEAGGRTISRTAARPQAQAAEVLNQIMDKMKLELKPGSTELKISLKPDELGNLTIKIVTESGHVTAEIVTENSKVKELVEQNISTLKESLMQQGVDVGELSVSVGQQEADERMNQFMMEQRRSHARMSQIINKITGEEMSLDTVNYANEAEVNGNSVDFSA